jgi:phenylalanyl-tRNA synthetase beta chain
VDVPLSWLTLVAPGADREVEHVVSTLEQLGYEVDGVSRPDASLHGMKLAAVLDRRPHPAADRLFVLTLSTGDAEPVQVVTAALNGAVGERLWYAPPGTVLPDGRTLGVEHFRGVPSVGMLLSADELGYGGSSDGLLVWGGSGAVGETWEAVMGAETVLHLSLTPNLAQFGHSILGVARDLRAAWHQPLPVLPEAPDADPAGGRVQIEAGDLCPAYTLAEFRCTGPVGEIPWIWRRRLTLAGARALQPIVDATNAVRIELGQPLHAFDADRVALPIAVRRAHPGEPLTLLDGRTLSLDADDLVIADQRGAVALAGVMGGLSSAVGSGTTRVLVESAHFDRQSVYRTARRHQIASEAALRFGRGTDPAATQAGVARFAQFLDLFGVDHRLVAMDHEGVLPEPRRVPVQPDRIRVWTGLDLSDRELVVELERLGFAVHTGVASVPSWRPDVEGPQDLAEEVARLVGMDRVSPRLPERSGIGRVEPETHQADRVRDLLAAAGFMEVVTPSFIAPGVLQRLGLPPEVHRVRNPLRERESVMRTSVWPGLLEVARYNRDRGVERVAIFEVGPVYGGRSNAPLEYWEVGLLATLGEWDALHGPERMNVFHLKGIVDELSRRHGWQLQWADASPPAACLHPGRALAITRGGDAWGELGELHPATLAEWRLPRTAVARWRLPRVVEGDRTGLERPITPSPYPGVRRDLSLRIPEDVTWESVHRLIAQHAGPDLEAIHAFDRYVDPELGTSVAVTLRYRAYDRTLTEDEVEARVAVLVAALQSAGVSRRT